MNKLLLAGLALVLAACAGESRDLPVAEVDCRTGLYRSADGEALILTPTTDGGYRWRTLDGRTGRIAPEAEGWTNSGGFDNGPAQFEVALGACDADAIQFGEPGALAEYAREVVEITEAGFAHDGLTFSGRLIWPAGAEQAPLVVHTHGSERWSQVRSGSMAWALASQGIASFVYDKRGTGQSEGEYTQDFHVLAGDAIAALAQARTLAGDRAASVGFLGGSQGGWIGPLAASQSEVDFVVALFGLAECPLAEDRGQVIRDVADAGFGPEEQARAAELSDAAGVIIASNFREGFAEFDRLRQQYRDEPWYSAVQGEYTGDMLPHHEIGLRIVGPMRNEGTTWRYDPMPVLRGLDAPQFWVIAADDTEAPPDETIRRIRQLQAEGRPIDLAIYPDANHGMIVIERGPDGAVRNPGHVRDYYLQVGAWINARDLSYAEAAGAEVSRGGVSAAEQGADTP